MLLAREKFPRHPFYLPPKPAEIARKAMENQFKGLLMIAISGDLVNFITTQDSACRDNVVQALRFSAWVNTDT